MRIKKALVGGVWLALTGVLLAQAPDPSEKLAAALAQTRQKSAALSPSRRVLGARFEILEAQYLKLMRGEGDWNVFFRFFEETREQVSSTPLPAVLQPGWQEVQEAVESLARERGYALPAVSSGARGDFHALGEAARLVGELERELDAYPKETVEPAYREARAQLRDLSQILRKCLDEFKKTGQASSYSAAVRERRRFLRLRGALGLPPGSFTALDEALLSLPRTP